MSDQEKIELYEKHIENIDMKIAGIATNDIHEYEINGRKIKKYTVPELIQLSNYFQNKLNSLKQKNNSRKILTRFI